MFLRVKLSKCKDAHYVHMYITFTCTYTDPQYIACKDENEKPILNKNYYNIFILLPSV